MGRPERSSAEKFEDIFGFAPLALSDGGYGDITGREFVRRALRGLACEFKQRQALLETFVRGIRAIDITVLFEADLLELQGKETYLRASLAEAQGALRRAERSARFFKYLPSSS